ncbi:hypothetical protein SAMN06265360_13914 [Haloechinothrix alba]|uniref:Uncharacterized protein n=1 Tax=Haloechinothrix alba TaxID=664784 RepID=A0A239AFS6_9PSEU|nr:hypothetical protein SAMN06265360_13914 [Haloechinothrix alba]
MERLAVVDERLGYYSCNAKCHRADEPPAHDVLQVSVARFVSRSCEPSKAFHGYQRIRCGPVHSIDVVIVVDHQSSDSLAGDREHSAPQRHGDPVVGQVAAESRTSG